MHVYVQTLNFVYLMISNDCLYHPYWNIHITKAMMVDISIASIMIVIIHWLDDLVKVSTDFI